MTVSRRPATPFAFDLARRALRAALIQHRRIFEPRVESAGTLAEPIETAGDVLIDVHFYFIALRNVHRFLKRVIADESFDALMPEFDILNETWLAPYSSAREAFEHIDQRLPGERYEDRIVDVPERGTGPRKIHYAVNLRLGLFYHSDHEWDISATAFEQVRAQVQQLMDHVLERAETLREAGTK